MAKERKSTSTKQEAAAVVAEGDGKSKKRSSFTVAEEAESNFVPNKVEEVLENGDCENASKSPIAAVNKKDKKLKVSVEKEEDEESSHRFLGESISSEEARKRWPHRYQKNKMVTEEITQARRHFVQAEVDGQVFNLEDDAYVKADEGKKNYICKIIEFFEAVDGSPNFTAQWYYRATDTVIKDCGNLSDDKCIFYSEIKDDNPLDCLVKKLNIVFLPQKIEFNGKEKHRPAFDYYYNKTYLLPYSSFISIQSDSTTNSNESGSTISSDAGAETISFSEVEKGSSERTVLDLYSGCGAMSTGLCLGANSCGVKLVTKWAVDINQYACESLRLNHPETQVRNESAENFLYLVKEWEKLCMSHLSSENSVSDGKLENSNGSEGDEGTGEDIEDDVVNESEIFEVQEILSICYGDPNESKKPGLHFKVRWKGYGPAEDTWEPSEGLSDCQEKLKEFVSRGYKSKILPLPGTVDVVCGGPPCQGISGFNRFRNKDKPLEDPKK